jgi:hypothetical protein
MLVQVAKLFAASATIGITWVEVTRIGVTPYEIQLQLTQICAMIFGLGWIGAPLSPLVTKSAAKYPKRVVGSCFVLVGFQFE